MSYGQDTWMRNGVLTTGRMATGVDLLAQAIYCRLTTPRGTLDDGDEGIVYGLDLCEFIGRQTTADAAASIPAAVEAELSKDDRFATVAARASVTRGTDGLDAIALAVDVVPYDEQAAAPFTLTLAVSAVTVAVLGVSPS